MLQICRKNGRTLMAKIGISLDINYKRKTKIQWLKGIHEGMTGRGLERTVIEYKTRKPNKVTTLQTEEDRRKSIAEKIAAHCNDCWGYTYMIQVSK
jgi:hypothetical protein